MREGLHRAGASRPTPSAGARAPEPPALELQRAIGNAAVSRLVLARLQATPVQTHPTIREGDDNVSVGVAKVKLNAVGAEPPQEFASYFGARMTKAVVDFQRRRKLSADGVIGPKTWGALDEMTAGRTPDEAELVAVAHQLKAAKELKAKGDHAGAIAIYRSVYANQRMTPELRRPATWHIATAEHEAGNYDEAISYYSEYIALPDNDDVDRRDALQRIREARLGEPPGTAESNLGDAEVDPTARSAKHPTLHYGDQTDVVGIARLKLNACNANPMLPLSISFDDAMLRAVKDFQKRKKLSVDGIVGPQTWAALDTLSEGRTPDEAELHAGAKKLAAAEALYDAGDHAGAERLYRELYADRKMTPELRRSMTWSIATLVHRRGKYDEAISFYSEYLALPGGHDHDRRDALQRIRQARLREPPGTPESRLGDAEVDPNARSDKHPTLYYGENSVSVGLARIKLNACNAEPLLELDSHFDTPMLSAVKDFQRRKKLTIDGIVGPQTWAALDTLTEGRTPDEAELHAVSKQIAHAHELDDQGDHAAAEAIYRSVYANPRMTPELRRSVTWSIATALHERAQFQEAIEYYSEYIALRAGAAHHRRDALQRIREARLGRPPGKIESKIGWDSS